MKELFQSLDQLSINLTQGNMLIVNIILAFVMFGVALGIKMQTFKDVFRNPKSVLLGLGLQWIVLPAVTTLLVIVLNPVITPMMAIGMILVASCPGGNISNFISSLSKGNVELSVSMTAVSTAFAPLVTPFNFWFWGSLYTRFASVRNDIPTLEIPFSDMLYQILIILGLPILLGFLVSRFLPNLADRLKKPTSIISILLFIAMVVVSVHQVLSGLGDAGQLATAGVGILAVLLIVIIHNASALGSGYLTATMFKLPKADRRSLTVETGIQNSGLGLAMILNANIFDPTIWSHNGGMVLITALWGVWHIVSGLSVAYLFRRKPLK